MTRPEDGKFQDDVEREISPPSPPPPTGLVCNAWAAHTHSLTLLSAVYITPLTSQEEDDLRDLKEDPGVASSHRERRSVHSATPPLLTLLRSFCKKGVESQDFVTY